MRIKDGWYEEELADLVFGYGVEHGFHGEGGEHVDFCIENEGEVEGMDETGYVEGGENRQDFFVGAGCYLLDLETLGYYVLVGYHDLLQSAPVPGNH